MLTGSIAGLLYLRKEYTWLRLSLLLLHYNLESAASGLVHRGDCRGINLVCEDALGSFECFSESGVGAVI